MVHTAGAVAQYTRDIFGMHVPFSTILSFATLLHRVNANSAIVSESRADCRKQTECIFIDSLREYCVYAACIIIIYFRLLSSARVQCAMLIVAVFARRNWSNNRCKCVVFAQLESIAASVSANWNAERRNPQARWPINSTSKPEKEKERERDDPFVGTHRKVYTHQRLAAERHPDTQHLHLHQHRAVASTSIHSTPGRSRSRRRQSAGFANRDSQGYEEATAVIRVSNAA